MPKQPESTFEPRRARIEAGRALRQSVPRSSHGAWKAAKKGRDALALLERSGEGRLAELLPLRYARMLQSPFAYLRGSAAVMAFDLAATPATGIRVQACGDCHLMNFGAFATPEGHLVFDINDFDETLAAPWEWDLKRLAASVVVAGRYRGFPERRCLDAVRATVGTYREMVAEYADAPTLEVWYTRIDAGDLIELGAASGVGKLPSAPAARMHAHAGAQLLPKLTRVVAGSRRIRDDPPLIEHMPRHTDYAARVREAVRRYRQSLPDERRALLDRFHLVDIARKVAGVGSVGTRCAVALFMADDDDPLFLQFKEARPSVLEPHAGRSRYRNHGERVVVGQRLMQSASDLFLGWSRTGRPAFDFYVRQLRDMKTSVHLDALPVRGFVSYARFCGRALARAHAKAGDAARIAGYLGRNDAFDRAIQKFARTYADQTERDHAALVKAVRAGRINAAADASP
ncbi:MAG TPA: DUF2252 domain-containing protein [Burkholderiales bacterium]|nr:DUF2252 domain-containing protein [Burkholderiales bacterium]